MLASWKLDPYTVMKLDSGRRGDDVLKGEHLACSSHKPLTSSHPPVTKRLQAGQDQGFRIVYPAKYYLGLKYLISSDKLKIKQPKTQSEE